MKILLLSRFTYLAPGPRYRYYQYLPYLREQGFDVTIAPLLDDDYLHNRYSEKKISSLYLLDKYLQRVAWLIKSRRYDLIWMEKEALPFFPAWLELLLLKSNVPYVVDYDDATFHTYDQHNSSVVRWILGQKIDRVMQAASLVIAGNDYLAERAEKAGAAWVEILPTVIDLDRYPLAPPPDNEIFTIGWIGSPTTSMYLLEVHTALEEICRDSGARVVAIGAANLELPGVPLTIKPWSEATEVEEIQKFDVGIMPLPNLPWSRGKCGFKLIQYMACSRPVIGSPVGVNPQIVDQKINGFLPNSTQEWIQALEKLRNDRVLRQQLGKAGRAKVEAQYCIQVTAPKLANLLRKVKRTTSA